MANRSRTLSKLWRRFLNGPPLWAIDLPGVKRFSKNGKTYYRTKEWLRGARQRARAMTQAKKSHRWRRKIERRRVRAMFSGTGQRKGGMLHELKGVSAFTPVGSLAYDRMVIAAMPIGVWCSAGEIAERAQWPAKPERASKWGRRALHPVGTVLNKRLVSHGFAVKKRARGIVPRRAMITRKMQGVVPLGRMGTSYRLLSVYRLTEAGEALKAELERGRAPERKPRSPIKAWPLGSLDVDQFVLCAMLPGEWWTVREICERAGIAPKEVRRKEYKARNGLRQRLVPGGMVERAENADRLKRHVYPFDIRPQSFFRLTKACARLRDGLMLIG